MTATAAASNTHATATLSLKRLGTQCSEERRLRRRPCRLDTALCSTQTGISERPDTRHCVLSGPRSACRRGCGSRPGARSATRRRSQRSLCAGTPSAAEAGFHRGPGVKTGHKCHDQQLWHDKPRQQYGARLHAVVGHGVNLRARYVASTTVVTTMLGIRVLATPSAQPARSAARRVTPAQ